MAPTSPRRVFFVFSLQYYPGKTNFSFSALFRTCPDRESVRHSRPMALQ